MIIFIILLILALATIYVLIKTSRKTEGFEDYNKNLMGYEEGLPAEYRLIDYPKSKKDMWNKHAYEGNNWHLRFPYMINQRYSYDDSPNKCQVFPTIYNYAHLKELPLELKNFQYGTVPFNVAKNSALEYYPDTTNKKYERKDKSLLLYPPYNRQDYPLLVDSRTKVILPNKRMIVGFDYDNMNDSSFNAGKGTPDDYYYLDRLNNRIY